MPGKTKDPTTTKLYADTVALYDAMLSRCAVEPTTSGEFKVYRGFVTQLMSELDIARSMYSKIMSRLHHYACINVLAAGSRGTPSVIVLLQSPTLADWTEDVPDARQSDLTRRVDYATLVQRVKDLEKIHEGLKLREVLLNFEGRLQTLEAKANGKE